MSPFYPGFQSKPWAKISERFQRYFLEICLSIFGCKRQSYDLDYKVMTARKAFMPHGQEITLRSRLSRRQVERLVMWRFVEFPCLLLLADNQVLPRLNAYELHFSGLRPSERANQKITEDGNVLVFLTFNVLRNITVSLHSEALLRNTEHPPGSNSPEAKRRSPVVYRQPATDSKAVANQPWVLATRLFFRFRCWRLCPNAAARSQQ